MLGFICRTSPRIEDAELGHPFKKLQPEWHKISLETGANCAGCMHYITDIVSQSWGV